MTKVYAIAIGNSRIAFSNYPDAQKTIARWNEVSDRRATGPYFEEWTFPDSTIWHRAPEATVIVRRQTDFGENGEVLPTHPLLTEGSSMVFEWQERFTQEPARRGVSVRPGREIRVEAFAYGTDRAAVERAHAEACREAKSRAEQLSA